MRGPVKMGRRGRALAVAAVAAVSVVASACGTATPSALRTGSSTATQAVFNMGTVWGVPASVNPFSPHYFGDANDFVYLPLAIPTQTLGHYIPELAASWKATPSVITIHLRADAKWQDGHPVTSKDVVTTLELEGANGNNLWSQVTSVTASGPRTVVVKLKADQPYTLVLLNLLELTIVPSSVYGRYVTPGLASELKTYWAQVASGSANAAKSPAGKAVGDVLTSVEKFSPKSYLGDGPFKITKVTNSAILFRKWTGFWGASRIHVPEIDFLNGVSSTQAEEVFSHAIDMVPLPVTYPLYLKARRTAGIVYNGTGSNYQVYELVVNSHDYPLSLVKVREALYYAIDRVKLAALEGGGKAFNPPTTYPTGLLNSTATSFLTRKQLTSLNRYPYNPGMAASLLKGLGFHKVGGKWKLPDGKEFDLSIATVSSYTDWEAYSVAVANMLNSFGIHTTVRAVPPDGYSTGQDAGQYELSWTNSSSTVNPLSQLASVIGTTLNYISPTERGIGFGPTMTVPGLGKVDVPETISQQASTTNIGPGLKSRTAIWASFFNKELPALPMGDKTAQVILSGTKWTDFPPAHSSLWALQGYNFTGGFMHSMQLGYYRPKQ